MITKPLTDEQLWGHPIQKNETNNNSEDWCPYKKRKCSCWDHGCQVELCVVDIAEAQITMQMFLEAE